MLCNQFYYLRRYDERSRDFRVVTVFVVKIRASIVLYIYLFPRRAI